MALRVLKWAGIALGLLLLVLVGLALWPTSTAGLGSTARPVTDYDAAVAEVERIRDQDVRDGVIDPCLSRLCTSRRPKGRQLAMPIGIGGRFFPRIPRHSQRFRDLYEDAPPSSASSAV